MKRNKRYDSVIALGLALSMMLSGCSSMSNNANQMGTSVEHIYAHETNESMEAGSMKDVFSNDVKYPEVPHNDKELEQYLEDNRPDEEEIEELQDFSWETAARLISNTGKNENYSPASLYFALSLLAAGAEGKTAEELYDLLNADTRQELIERSSKLFRWLSLFEDPRMSSTSGDLKIANSLWLQNGINFKEEYKTIALNDFYSGIFNVNFGNTDTGKLMAEWISKHTKDLLKPEISVNPSMLMSIINTVYFYDEWLNGFDKNNTSEGNFYISNDENASGLKRDFMKQELTGQFYKGSYKGSGFTRAGLKLKNREKMVFVLPDKGIDLDLFMSDSEALKETFTEGEESFGFVEWEIPKFSFESSYDITDAVRALGIESICSSEADFSHITDEKISVSEVSQKTHIGIDEKGVEAAAYTIIELMGAAPAEERAEMILNRPFMYAIMTDDGIPLFIGAYRGSEDMIVCEGEVPVTISVKKIADGEIELLLKKNTNTAITYGEAYLMQTYKDGAWVEMAPVPETYGFNDIAYIIDIGDTETQKIKYEWLYGKLDSGRYRIVKEIMTDNIGSIDIISSEFEIK